MPPLEFAPRVLRGSGHPWSSCLFTFGRVSACIVFYYCVENVEFYAFDHDLRTALIFCYHLKKIAAESHQTLVEAYGGNALSRAQCYRWFEKFQNGDLHVRNEERGRPAKKFEDAELKALIDEDDGQTQEHRAEQLNVDQSTISRRLKAMGKIIKVGRWVPHELTDRQQENPKFVCEMLLARYKRKLYLHRIVAGDEKWIYFENPKRNRSYVDPGQPFKSTTRPNRFGRKTILCIFWDQEERIYYMIFSNPTKPLILIATSNNYLI
ncbi:mariner Mos1 transposase [Trichonephila clavipes]|nr:mariner Mos1 transposase [Trichonephila clavipes]